jgi:hypothetical protein
VADVPSGLNLTPTQEIALRIKTCSTKYWGIWTCVVKYKLSVLSILRVTTEIRTDTDIFLLYFSLISLTMFNYTDEIKCEGQHVRRAVGQFQDPVIFSHTH